MDPSQLVVPMLGIVAAAAVTFYVVSFSEMSEKSFEKLSNKYEKPRLRSSITAKEKRNIRKSKREVKQNSSGDN